LAKYWFNVGKDLLETDLKLNRRGILICFIGIDGSGKTTISKLVNINLTNRGLNSTYMHLRFVSIVLKLLIKLKNSFLIKEEGPQENAYRSLMFKKVLLKNRLISYFHEWFVLLGHCFQIFYKIYSPLYRHKSIVLCDRYIYDTIVDLMIDHSWTRMKALRMLEISFRILPRPDLLFIIDIPENIAFSRKRDIPSIGFLSIRRVLYLTLFREYGPIVLNGLDSLTNLNKSIIQKLLRRLN
jgi:dTMP kinase